jgi:hypothetical protein
MRKILIPALFLITACSPLRHYRKVVNDPFRNKAERELLARASQQEFPNVTSDTPTITVTYDTVFYEVPAQEKGSEIVTEIAIRDTIIKQITRTIRPAQITKTIKIERQVRDAAWAELKENEVRQARWENERLQIQLNEAKTDSKTRIKIIYWMGGILAFFLILVIWKPKIPSL